MIPAMLFDFNGALVDDESAFRGKYSTTHPTLLYS